MGMKIKDLCRLCAKKHEFSKDLLDDSNKNVSDLIRQFTQIVVTECDNMPTKVCLDCEEKMVSFQLFILECYKVQDTLRKLYLDNCKNLDIKVEEEGVEFGMSIIKSEVKDELTAEDILSSAINNGQSIESYDGDDYLDNDDEDDGEDDDDNVTIAKLKELKTTVVKKKVLTEEEAAEFNELMKKPSLKINDLVKMECKTCNLTMKTWPNLQRHCFNKHKCKAIAYCLCGYAIKSRSVLYYHFMTHKSQNKKLRKALPEGQQIYDQSKIKDFVDFKCTHCGECCTSWYTLKSHCETIHNSLPLVQCTCGVILKSKSVMYKHIQDHKNPSTLSCDQCSKIMKSPAALSRHKLRHIPKSERKYCCHTCNKIFNNKELLRSHARSHIPIEERKVFNCEICNLKFTTRSSATSHKRVVHEKVKAYVCDLCGYACGTNGELRQHRAIHSDEKPYVCRKCNKQFKTYSNLKTHMDTHEDTSYACYVCNRVLNSRRTLRKHLLVHEDKCRHVCSYCNKAFKRRQTLKVHMYTHTGDKPLSCKWCDERFSYASTLRSHRLRCHPEKMTQTSYNTYSHAQHIPPQDYIKNDLAAIGVTKNEVEAIQ